MKKFLTKQALFEKIYNNTSLKWQTITENDSHIHGCFSVGNKDYTVYMTKFNRGYKAGKINNISFRHRSSYTELTVLELNNLYENVN